MEGIEATSESPEPEGGQRVGVVDAPTQPSLALPAFGHEEFSGQVPGRIEPNGRVIIPSTYRYAFTGLGKVLALPKADDYLALYTRAGFNQFLDTSIARQPDKVMDPRFRVDAYAMAPKLAIDKQWRIVIPENFRETVGLDEEVVFVGAVEALRIMTPQGAAEVLERAGMLTVLLDSWPGLSTDPA